jgi:hypothetical protein
MDSASRECGVDEHMCVLLEVMKSCQENGLEVAPLSKDSCGKAWL